MVTSFSQSCIRLRASTAWHLTTTPTFSPRLGDQVRVIDPGSGYLCQQEPVAHFGLGAATADLVTIIWPGGEHVEIVSPAIDTQIVVPFPTSTALARV